MIFSGLGFNIVGGTDQQYVSNDSGIYVSRIKENGAAALDGRLQEGDKILSVRTGFGLLHCPLFPRPYFLLLTSSLGRVLPAFLDQKISNLLSSIGGTLISHLFQNYHRIWNILICFDRQSKSKFKKQSYFPKF